MIVRKICSYSLKSYEPERCVMNKKENRSSALLWIVLLLVVFIVAVFLVVRSTRNNTADNNSNKDVTSVTTDVEKDNSAQPSKPEDFVNSQALAKLPQEFIPKGNRQVVPEFTLPDLDQNPVSLSDFEGKFVLIDFTTTWCRWCEVQKPSILELMEKHPDDFRVLAIDVQETEQEIRAHYPNGPEYPLVLDKDGSITQMFGVQGFPFYLLVSPSGEMVYYQSGYLEDMTQRVTAVIEEVRKNG